MNDNYGVIWTVEMEIEELEEKAAPFAGFWGASG